MIRWYTYEVFRDVRTWLADLAAEDAHQYFGTADLYLGYLLDFLKPGGQRRGDAVHHTRALLLALARVAALVVSAVQS